MSSDDFLTHTPYLLSSAAIVILEKQVQDLEDRVALLRRQGTLTDDTIKDYYGQTRFEQIAESNAIEGSTLSAGETEVAVLKGITITGHDPAFIRDAIALDKALTRVVELARTKEPTDIPQLQELHELILGDRQGAGIFRSSPVTIRGARHVPPKTWEGVMNGMEAWQTWSRQNVQLVAPLRAALLHAWLSHIHPFIDGNGRCARALSNLELIRRGYPPIIIRKKERDRYIDALAQSDEGGDIAAFVELVLGKIETALKGLEASAARKQGYSPEQERIKRIQEQKLEIWTRSVGLLARIMQNELEKDLAALRGVCTVRMFENDVELDDYLTLCEGRPASKTWAFTIAVAIPSFRKIERLAWFGHRSHELANHRDLADGGGPSVFWSVRNPGGYPPWLRDDNQPPTIVEMTTPQGSGDTWVIRRNNGRIEKRSTTDLSKALAREFMTAASS